MKFVTFQNEKNSQPRFGFKKNDYIIDIDHASNWVNESNNDSSFLGIPSSLKGALENWTCSNNNVYKKWIRNGI